MSLDGRVLIVGDPHLKVSRTEDAERFIDQLKTHISERGYEYVIILGDLFDTFAVIRSEVLSIWSDFVSWMRDSAKPTLIMLVGNHDYAGHNGGSHALEAFASNALVVDKRVDMTINGVNVVLLPFIRDREVFEQTCRDIPAGSVLFCHQSFNGAKFENGFYDPEGADPSCVSHLARVVSGHIHSSQSIGENIYYPGSPFQQSFGEAGQRKAIVYMNIGETVQQKCQSSKFFELDMPTFHEVELSCLDPKELPQPSLDKNYKIIASGTPQEISAFKNSKEYVALKNGSRKVSDAISVIRDNNNIVFDLNKNKTPQEKMTDFINKKTWRSNREVLIGRARHYLSQK